MTGFGRSQKSLRAKDQVNPVKTEEVIRKSLSAYRKGDLVNAKLLLVQLLEANQVSSFVLGFLATVEKALGNKVRAAQLFEESINIDQSNPDFLHNYSALLAESDLRKAIRISDKAVGISPSNGSYVERNGYLKWKLGDLSNALNVTLKALELNPHLVDAHINLGGIYKDLGDFEQALALTNKSLELNPDNPNALMNLGEIYKCLGKFDQALACTLKALVLKQDNPVALMNLGGIYKDLGSLEQALTATHKSLEINPGNHIALVNLGGIYKDLGDFDQALDFTLKSLKLNPKSSKALLGLGTIQMALGNAREAKKSLLAAIKNNSQEHGAYYQLSLMLETVEEAEELIKFIDAVRVSEGELQSRALIEFAKSNCLHKKNNYHAASYHLQLANKCKSLVFPSNVDLLLQSIAKSVLPVDHADKTNINSSSGNGRIFIVGMPRSGSTLLETMLSMNPEVKDLGETCSLGKAIAESKRNSGCCNVSQPSIYDLYSRLEPMSMAQYKYTTDKNLYNFVYINFIVAHMPAAKIIYCRRNPMDNILSMYRANMASGNNYTSILEDAARVLVAQQKAMQMHKKNYPQKIFTFDYDRFVSAPREGLSGILEWLELDFQDVYLHPEKSTRAINTSSVMQARRLISSKSVGSWRKYENLLSPALAILERNNVFVG